MIEIQDDIRERVLALIARHAGVVAESVARTQLVWQLFPHSSGRYAHPTVTTFIHDVHSGFDVYLTAAEWEEATPDSLAVHIRAKLDDPTASRRDWAHDRDALQRGKVQMLAFAVILGVIALLSASGSWTRRALVASGLVVFMSAMFLAVYRLEARKLESSMPRQWT